jgi:hypothetical protein
MMNGDEKDEEENDTTLIVRLSIQNQSEVPTHEGRNRCWRHKSMEPIHLTYNFTYSDPPNDNISLFNYFEKFTDNSIIQNLDQTNLYAALKTGKSINTSVLEISQFIGIHILGGVVRCQNMQCFTLPQQKKNCFKDFHIK